jgi:hypothetical protein
MTIAAVIAAWSVIEGRLSQASTTGEFLQGISEGQS